MSNTRGTPKNLLGAIDNARAEDWAALEDRAGIFEAHIIDFLSQKFGTAMLENPEHEQVLRDLWNKITKR